MSKKSKKESNAETRRYVWPLLIVVFLLLILLITIWFMWFRHSNLSSQEKKRLQTTQSINDNKRAYESIYSNMLKNKKYEDYQIAVLVYYDGFMNNKDFESAKSILNEILKNVPSEKIDYRTYYALSSFYKSQNDKAQYRKYTELLVGALKEEGMKEDAAYYEKQLQG